MAPSREWLARRSEGAPDALRARALAYVPEREVPSAEALGAAGLTALEATLGLGPDRPAALDLLAADALVTLALQAQAEHDPAGLEELARALRRNATTTS